MAERIKVAGGGGLDRDRENDRLQSRLRYDQEITERLHHWRNYL
jgi:hypothetical protein